MSTINECLRWERFYRPNYVFSRNSRESNHEPQDNGIRILSIQSAKGGVGKTTFSYLLADLIRRKNKDSQVLLIDLDFLGTSYVPGYPESSKPSGSQQHIVSFQNMPFWVLQPDITVWDGFLGMMKTRRISNEFRNAFREISRGSLCDIRLCVKERLIDLAVLRIEDRLQKRDFNSQLSAVEIDVIKQEISPIVDVILDEVLERDRELTNLSDIRSKILEREHFETGKGEEELSERLRLKADKYQDELIQNRLISPDGADIVRETSNDSRNEDTGSLKRYFILDLLPSCQSYVESLRDPICFMRSGEPVAVFPKPFSEDKSQYTHLSHDEKVNQAERHFHMFDPLYSQQICEYLFRMIFDIFDNVYYKKKHLYVILDNGPGWNMFLPTLQNYLLEWGIHRTIFLLVSSWDVQDIRSTYSDIEYLRYTYSKIRKSQSKALAQLSDGYHSLVSCKEDGETGERISSRAMSYLGSHDILRHINTGYTQLKKCQGKQPQEEEDPYISVLLNMKHHSTEYSLIESEFISMTSDYDSRSSNISPWGSRHIQFFSYFRDEFLETLFQQIFIQMEGDS